MKKLIYLSILCLLAACSYHIEKKDLPNARVGQLDASQVGFAEVQSVIFQPKCARCHGGDVVASYNSVKANLPEISRRLQLGGGGDTMPPSGPLDPAEIQLFLLWVQAGAPEVARSNSQAGNPTPAPPSVPAPPAPPITPPVPGSFAEVEAKVFQPRCLKCHSHMLDTYEHVQPILAAIDSKISDGTMPPSRATQLTEEEKQLVLRWIASGASEQGPAQDPPASPPTPPAASPTQPAQPTPADPASNS